MSFFQSLVLSLFSSAVFTSALPNGHSLHERSTAAAPLAAAEYEYIVVGSGAGGGPLAARLALNGKSVLLIEAGEDNGNDLLYQVPAFHAYATEDPAQAWGYYVQHYADPVRAAQDSKMTWTTPSGQLYVGKNPPSGSTMKGIFYPRAGTLGGCTAHNALVNIYPHEKDWDHIVDITGDDTWNHRNMRKIYQRIEKLDYYTVDGGHGYDGWLGVGRADITLALNDTKVLGMAFAAAAGTGSGPISDVANLIRVLGGDANGDTIRNEKEGTYNIPLARYDNKRNGAREFINQVYNARTPSGDKRYPLDISFDTLVTKVTFDNSSSPPRANGVDVLFGKSLYKADPRAGSASPGTPGTPGLYTASKEVILSGGTFNTPQLLKLSGIGPREELTQFGIPVISDLKGVGTNLQDHFEIGVSSKVPTPFAVVEHCTFDKTPNDWCLQNWYDQKGPYSTNGFLFAMIHRSSVAAGDTVFGDDPDLLIFGGLADFKGYYPGYSNDVYKTKEWTWVVLKGHTGNYGPNAGTVRLRSADPTDTPDILFNFFDAGSSANGAPERDLQAMAEGVGLSRSVNDNAKDLSALLSGSPFEETRPGQDISSDSAVKEHIKQEAWSHHASCTCPIGADDDPWAVLDSKLRVRGTAGLRVADASVFPRIPGFFVAVPTYMIGEKAADILLNGD